MGSGERNPFHQSMGMTHEHKQVSVSRRPSWVYPLRASISVQAAKRMERYQFLNCETGGATQSWCRKYGAVLLLSVHSLTPITRRTEPARSAGRASSSSRVAGTCPASSPPRPHRLLVGLRGHRAGPRHLWRYCWPSRPTPPGGACRWAPAALSTHVAALPAAAGGADARPASAPLGGAGSGCTPPLRSASIPRLPRRTHLALR